MASTVRSIDRGVYFVESAEAGGGLDEISVDQGLRPGDLAWVREAGEWYYYAEEPPDSGTFIWQPTRCSACESIEQPPPPPPPTIPTSLPAEFHFKTLSTALWEQYESTANAAAQFDYSSELSFDDNELTDQADYHLLFTGEIINHKWGYGMEIGIFVNNIACNGSLIRHINDLHAGYEDELPASISTQAVITMGPGDIVRIGYRAIKHSWSAVPTGSYSELSRGTLSATKVKRV